LASFAQIVRAPFLELVTLLLQNMAYKDSLPELTQIVVSHFAQHQCCWYSVCKKKACSLDGLSSSVKEGYVFCRKHWSSVLKKELVVGNGRMCPPSELETVIDEWHDMIV
jgi:hypothetical protein